MPDPSPTPDVLPEGALSPPPPLPPGSTSEKAVSESGVSSSSGSNGGGSGIGVCNYQHAWNAVFIDGQWRLVDCTWSGMKTKS